jgi:hypothetical protein
LNDWTNFIHLRYSIFSIIGYKYSISKNRDPSDILQNKNIDILGNYSSELYYFSIFYGDHLPKYSWVGDISCKIRVHALGVQMRYVDFVETSFTGRTNFIVVRYSSSYNGLPSNNRFRFHGNVAQVSGIRESMCVFCTHIFLIVSVVRERVIWHWGFRLACYIPGYSCVREIVKKFATNKLRNGS